MFQANQRGWKHLAASLMLLPGLTAVGAEALNLLGTARAQERRAPAQVRATNEDPRMLVRRAKEALDNGRLDNALDLARQAEANGRQVEWKLFEDTPESVLKDVMKAIGRRDRGNAEKLVSQARALAEKPAGTLEQRSLNLDKARSMCLEAIQLHGPYSMWHFGEKPEAVLKDIDTARVKLGLPAGGSADTRVADTRPKVSTPSLQGDAKLTPKSTGYTPPTIARKDSKVDFYVPPAGWDEPAPKKTAIANAPRRDSVASPFGGTEIGSGSPQVGGNVPPIDGGLGGGTVVSRTVGKSPVVPFPKGGEIVQTQRIEPSVPFPKADLTKVDPLKLEMPKVEAPRPEVTKSNPPPVDFPPPEMRNFDPPKIESPPEIVRKDVPTEPKLELPPMIEAPPEVVRKGVPVTPTIELPPMTDEQPVVRTPEPDAMPRLVPPKQQVVAVRKQPEPPAPAVNEDKIKAAELMQHASALQKGDKLVEARAKLVEAQKLNVLFSPDEDTPEMVLQSLTAMTHKRINKLGSDASIMMMRKTDADVAAAEKMLVEAEDLVMGFGFDPYAVINHRERLSSVKREMAAAKIQSEKAPPVEAVKAPAETPPVPVPPVEVVKAPVEAPPMVQPPVDVVKAPVERPLAVKPPVEAPDPGAELLAQARTELQRNQLEAARKLAVEVMATNSKLKDQAQALVRTIHAEETLQKQEMSRRSYERGVEALYAKNYEQALSIFKLIDPNMLPASKQRLMNDQMMMAQRQLDAKANAVAQAKAEPAPAMTEPLAPPVKSEADSLVKQEEAMRELQFQKLRAEGLQLEANATARFGKGETDAAMADLQGFVARVKASSIDPAKVKLLTQSIENRIEKLKVLKHQQDWLVKEAKDLRDFRTSMNHEALHEQHKKQEVAKLMKDFGRLMDEGKFEEAGKVVMAARQLDPDDPVIGAAMQINRMRYREQKWSELKAGKEEYNWKQGNDAHDFGLPADSKDPVKFDAKRFNEIRNRASSVNGYGSLRQMSENEKRIESKLGSTVVDLDFSGQSLDDVVRYLQQTTGLNFYLDTRALQDERIDAKNSAVTCKLNQIPLKSALEYVLMQEKLKYVVDRDAVRITTAKGARGKLVQRTIPVADLVIPVQNYHSSSISSLSNQLENSMRNNRPNLPGGGSTPFTPAMGLPNATGIPTGSASLQNGGGALVNTPATSGGTPGVKISGASGTIEESLIRLITSSVQPDTWEAMGGMGRIEYYPLGMALVINQTPDVIEEVGRLLEALRQLQDLEVAIEVRMITLAETFYERIGLDFSMNIDTHNTKAASLLGQSSASNNNLTNIQNVGGKVVGLQAPGVPTPDLNLPIAATSFGMAIPPFGNFPNAPGADGGLSLGLAFLNDIQVQMFLEAAQGDRRTNVMQAPKLTMFNGQSASIQIQDQQFFLTGITVTSVNGQLVFTPQNQPFPLGVQMNMQPVVSGDRRFVRLNIQQEMTNLASATVPLFPITTIVTPVFEGGAQGQPVPFTQYIQQPTFSTINVSTTVVVPDGGTVLLGGLKTLNEGRNEFGPPVLSKIPYVSRLFRNVGYGRDAQSLMMMVTPRIIINREEQEKQTGVVESQNEFGGGNP